MNLIVYTLSDCPVSQRAVRHLRQHDIPFVERQVDDDEMWQDEVVRLTHQNTVPVFVRPDGCVEVGFEGEKG
ncbi:MAG: glutaredoxin [Chloroflexi bacterium]|nr:glutaredoxin [Chloroflexota bacterium]